MKLAAAGLLLVALTSTARAEDRALARQHYTRAVALIQAHQHKAAIVEFELAFAAAPLPNILYNIAQEHRTLGDSLTTARERVAERAEAIAFYRRYLEARKSAPDRREVEASIALLEGRNARDRRQGAARDHYDRAIAAIHGGRHRDAAKAFEEAYREAPQVNLLFDIAQEYRALGDSGSVADAGEIRDMRTAVSYYRRYLAEANAPSDRRDVELTIAELEERMRGARHRSGRTATGLREIAEGGELDEIPTVAVPRPLDDGGGARRAALVTLAIVGGAVLVAAVVTVAVILTRPPDPLADRDYTFTTALFTWGGR